MPDSETQISESAKNFPPRGSEAGLLCDAASVLRANEFPGLMSRSYAVALADVLEILAYVKRYEPYSDYMGTLRPDPSVALASLILGEEP